LSFFYRILHKYKREHRRSLSYKNSATQGWRAPYVTNKLILCTCTTCGALQFYTATSTLASASNLYVFRYRYAARQ
jgi:hypothetical protein